MRLLRRKGRPPFDVAGSIPDEWLADLARVASAVHGHPWGGPSLELLACGELPAVLRKYMPRDRFAEWQRGYGEGRIAVTGAINFVAFDGRRAAAVPPVSDRSIFLMLAGHEVVEAALDRRGGPVHQDLAPQPSRRPKQTSPAHVLRTEYTVERTRRQIFDELGLGYSPLDNGLVSKQVEELEAELPELVDWGVANSALPSRLVQHWYELARVYAMSLGRADEGSPADRTDLTAFRRHELVRQSAAGWDSLDGTLRRSYLQPKANPEGLDQFVLAEGWTRLYEGGLAAVWKPRYLAAGGVETA